jgi:hypothetical protein
MFPVAYNDAASSHCDFNIDVYHEIHTVLPKWEDTGDFRVNTGRLNAGSLNTG